MLGMAQRWCDVAGRYSQGSIIHRLKAPILAIGAGRLGHL